MSNFRINFAHPWFLLLLIPALGLTLLPYFRLAKRYRKTRNRICSMVLHMIVMFLAITLLAGITFSYELPNRRNEMIILVDSSYSNRYSEEEKEDFVADILSDCDSSMKVGVVKFGYDQLYAAPLSNDANSVYSQFRSSDEPDTSATDIAAALEYTAGLFNENNLKTAKIVLISDGIETDGEAMKVINHIAAQGIKVDTVCYPNPVKPEIQIAGVVTPDYNVDFGETFSLQVKVRGNVSGGSEEVTVTVYDEGTEGQSKSFYATEGDQMVELTHSFDTPGLHEIRVVLSNGEDTVQENNTYVTYMYMKERKNVLIIEHNEGEGAVLKTILTEKQFNVTDMSFEQDEDLIPLDISQLVQYEEVILVNIANSDMPEGFDLLLNDYVQNLGGGLFTVGGENDTNVSGDPIPHSYNREDMEGTLFQQMLPVQVVPYTPPIAVMILVDSSGSMMNGKLENALLGAETCVGALLPSDYCGVITFEDKPSQEVRVTPVSEKEKILNAIWDIGTEANGGTMFQFAIEAAGRALSAVDVEKRHIILVTDGEPGDKGKYEPYIEQNSAKGITMSVVAIEPSASAIATMTLAAELGNGRFYEISDLNKIATEMYSDLMKEIPEIKYDEEFQVKIGDHTAIVDGLKDADIPKLSGYYGTRLKNGAVQPLVGEYVPIYAQWKYGKGTVGSFMSDLSGNWSDKFVGDANGQQIIANIVKSLFPAKDLPNQDITIKLNEDNYTTQMGVHYREELKEDDVIEVTVTPETDQAKTYYAEKVIEVKASNGNTMFEFDITCPGVYKVTLTRKNALGEVTASTSFYKNLAYSEEYNAFPERELMSEELMEKIAKAGRGIVVEDYEDVFDSFERTIKYVHDPRVWYLITIIVLFLLDIAVRKFKFKWPHEIIRERREKKANNNK